MQFTGINEFSDVLLEYCSVRQLFICCIFKLQKINNGVLIQMTLKLSHGIISQRFIT